MSKFKVQNPVIHLPAIKEYCISASELRREYEACDIDWKLFDFEDSWYYHTDWEGWGNIFPVVFDALPKYIEDRFDCDNFALYIAVMTALKFRLNSYGRLEGFHNDTRHKWGTFFDGDSCYQSEPQTGMVYDMTNKEYQPEELEVG